MSVAGDDDKWMLLERVSADDYPLIVRSRINSAIDDFVASNCAIAVICDVSAEHVRDDGMPTCMDELYRLEDEIVASVANAGERAFHTASATGDGRRVIYFAAETSFDIEAFVGSIKSSVAAISVLKTLEMDVYRDFVAPTKLDRQSNGDRGLISNLESHGDDGSASRKIDFFFYGERDRLVELKNHLAAEGFEVNRWLDQPCGVILSRDGEASQSAFRLLTPLIVEAADECGVEYDGWETPLVGANPSPPEVEIKSTLLGKLFGKRKK